MHVGILAVANVYVDVLIYILSQMHIFLKQYSQVEVRMTQHVYSLWCIQK